MDISTCLANRYFLVVDDEEFVRSLVGRFLRQSGAAGVVDAVDGKHALAALASYDMAFDAVISDISMHPMNGLEMLRAIRTGTGGLKRNTPVLMLTAYAEADFVAEALSLDADAFLVKPVGREMLIDRVLRVLERMVPVQAATRYASGTESAGVPAGTNPSEASLSGGPVSAAQHVALEAVPVNSILAQDIRFGAAQKLLLAAPVILTNALLERLKDLRQLHNSYSHLWIVEPRIMAEEAGNGDAGTSGLTSLHETDPRHPAEHMVGDLFLAPTLRPEASLLVEQIRSQTTEVAERAQARVDRERLDAEPET
jgi:CheY-like chemotaxis protein